MADIIILEYRAQMDKFRADVRGGTTDMQVLDKTSVKAAQDTEKAFNKAAGSVSKVTTETKKIGPAVNQVGSQLASVAATLGIAFGVQQVIRFGTESVKAFIDAEKNAQQLLFALKGNENVQKQLLNQASELQDTTIYDDDTIQRVQTFLAFQGRTPDQIRKTTAAAVELATVMGTDVETAVRTLDATYEGNIGRLGKLDSGFKTLTKEQLANGAAVDLLNEKYGGTAKALGDTTFGQIEKLKNQFGELQETIGGQILPVITNLIGGLKNLSDGNIVEGVENLFDFFDRVQIVGPLKGVINAVREFRQVFEDLQNGDYLGALGDAGEGVANILSLGLYNTIKNQVSPATKELGEELTKASSSADLLALGIKKAGEFTQQTYETFQGLNEVLEITEKQFQGLTEITDKYGVSSNITTEAILGLKSATEEQLIATFRNFNQELGVTQEDFDEYVKRLRNIKNKQDEVAGSTEKLVGPYDRLSKVVSSSFKALQDQTTLFEQGNATWDSVIEKALAYAKAQNELVVVTDEVNRSLERSDREQKVVLETINTKIIPAERKLIEIRKLSAQEIQDRDDIFKQLNVNQVDSYTTTLQKLNELQAAEREAAGVHYDELIKIEQKYSNARVALQAEQFAGISTGISNIFGSLNTSITDIFGDAEQKTQRFMELQKQALEDGNKELAAMYGKAAEDSRAFAEFQKSITLIEVAFAQAGAIANAVKSFSSGNPLDIIGGIAGIIAAVGTIFGTLFSDLQGAQVPAAPGFFEGTDYLKLNGNPKGKDTIPLYGHEGEAIIRADKNREQKGLAKAWNGGKLEEYVISEWVTPALRKLEAKHKQEFAENLAASLMLQTGSNFDDFRLFMTLKEGNQINAQGLAMLNQTLKVRNRKRGGYN